MNIAEEKADELFQRMNKEGLPQISKVINRLVRKKMLKQCAIIVADENIKCLVDLYPAMKDEYTKEFIHLIENRVKFWQDVKLEINKL